jgi:hypothetical protein
MVQISKILIGMVFVTLIVTGMVLYLGGGATTYSSNNYNDTSFNKITDSFDEIENLTSETKDKMDEVKADDNILDRIGVFFSGGYTAVKVVGKSYDTLGDMSDVAVDELPLGAYGSTIKLAIGVIVLIVIFIMIILHFLIKSDRL